MRLLVLGGTAFLSREIAVVAVRAGHDVTCAARGTSGPVPDGASLVRWDRSADPVPPGLSDGAFDAVIDVARTPSWVRDAVAAIRAAHWVFVSTISVYADTATPGGGPSNLPLLPALHDDVALDARPEAYGAMKVACEELVRDACADAAVVRPGLIVGPGDPTGRFSYWPGRLASAADGDLVLAPGAPGARVQVLDVRDLAAWLVLLAERRTAGTFDAVAPAFPMVEFVQRMAVGLGVRPRWVWAPDDFLLARGVEPWAGERSLPLWLPRPDFDGMLDHDAGPAAERGLRVRPLDETARDTAEWLRTAGDALAVGMTRDDERALIRARTAE
ncbi:NAD-dependent epimerase/dehydratase family protein [Tsukamurella tyrosinosolvens]|uniref:NAD-dependent epimerase/dehydratase family protein n=1 Tax=Tsukamurella tyrosinosolvens TaxID=57704 RepID=UPI000DF6D312|nr:NAD-dependent epimerase/dehydratase family protein [Tsukamurella tyrosinosolvens]RDB44993.1 epimerase [Tsukamurella tyrosinosolvens]